MLLIFFKLLNYLYIYPSTHSSIHPSIYLPRGKIRGHTMETERGGCGGQAGHLCRPQHGRAHHQEDAGHGREQSVTRTQ